MKMRSIVVGVCGLVLAGCSSSDDPPKADVASLAGLANCVQENADQTLLCGKALAADGVTPLIGARISVDGGVSPSSPQPRGIADPNRCITDAQGEYACILPTNLSGNTTFKLEAEGFDSALFQSTVIAGEISIAQPQTLAADATVQWAVVPGEYDGVQVLLAQLKGCTLNDSLGNPWNSNNTNSQDARGSTDCQSKGLRVLESDETAFFTDGSLDQFDALFVNCDTDLSDMPGLNAAIQSFNQNGSHVYFSDLSDRWLSAVFPGKVEFAGTSTGVDSNFSATVVDSSLAAVVGANVELVFDLPGWTAVDTVSDDTTVYIEGDVSEISSYEGVKPITVGFKPESSAACVFFTSYHIEGASSGSDQELAIKYLIQNIETVCI